MKTLFLAVVAAAVSFVSASVIIIDTDTHPLNTDLGTQSTDCREFCADAGKQCRARGLPSQLCEVVQGQCAHECIETNVYPFPIPGQAVEATCQEKCVDESQKCREDGTDENVCYKKFVTCKDNCEQGKSVYSYAYAYELEGGSVVKVENVVTRTNAANCPVCYTLFDRCMGIDKWPIKTCIDVIQKCYQSPACSGERG